MAKIYMYNTTEAERRFIPEWEAEHPDFSVTADADNLDETTVARAEGYDGVTVIQAKPLDDSVYATLKGYGIKNIAQRGVGYDPFDTDKAKENGIIITTVPAYSPSSIAEFAVAQILNGVRHLYDIDRRSRQHDFREGDEIRGERIGSLTVGVLGTGRIGRTVAHIMHNGFGSPIVGYDLYPNEEAKAFIDYKDSVEAVVEAADIVTLHLPGGKDTFHLVDDELLSHFKDGAILINAARGALIDTKALLKALDSGKIAFAGLDVYENEFGYVKNDFRDKEIDDPVLVDLVSRENVAFSPHVAYYTNEAVHNMVYGGLDATANVIQTGDDEHRVN